MKGLPVLYIVMIGLTGCAEPQADQGRLAAQGLIQEDAPVKAVAQVVIAAPAAKILGLLTNVGAWPQWQPGISTAAIHGNPAVGAKFDWSSGSMQIHSTMQLIDPERVCWTGRVLHLHAIHCWTLSSLPDNTVW